MFFKTGPSTLGLLLIKLVTNVHQCQRAARLCDGQAVKIPE